ncbi:uncharacterized protein Ctps isoform X2 [Drosophila tropicalis]|uniref:uncharacterized protein Ctps isoform X2 n=1 Tax=Drosophila tropicalis TaxID=46794 RepID=UPI0035AB6E22
MAPKKSTIVLNVEQFIHDIEERPAIWNRNFHCNKAFLEQMWDELSGAHKLPKIVLKAKWKGLRDNFRVEYKRIPRADNGDFLVDPSVFESKWLHYYALLFLTDHMRHRLPKNEQDQSFYFNQQSQDCEKTVVEPDLTNGLIRQLHDSDEDYDEDDTETGDAVGGGSVVGGDAVGGGGDAADGDAGNHSEGSMEDSMPTPPAAHQNTQMSTTPLRAQLLELEKKAEDLSKKPIPPPRLVAMPTLLEPPHSAHCSSPPIGGGAKRSVSPPPLYNKAHHPLASLTAATHHAAAVAAAAAASKERSEDFTSSGAAAASAVTDHLSFTQHSYANGLIPALKLKRPRLSEDSNFNGSSTMDVPLVPEDDDYHYLLSLHPYMKQLTAAQKLRIRTKIQKLIFKELYKEDIEESK